MKWFNFTVIAALLGLFWISTTPAEPNTAKYRLVGNVNAAFADMTWDSPTVYNSNGNEALALDQSEATQYYLRNWFGVMVWILASLNLAFYAGKASNHEKWTCFKQELKTGMSERCKEWWARFTAPYNPKAPDPQPEAADTTEVFESIG
jgi:hypothetical protein